MCLFQNIGNRLNGKYSKMIRNLSHFKADCLSQNENNRTRASNGKGCDRLINFADAALNYLRWRRWFGYSILNRLGIHKPSIPCGLPSIVAQFDGYDLENEICILENSLVVGDILLQKPLEGADFTTFQWELDDIVLPSVLRRRIKDFNEKYERLYNQLALYYAPEGPYEINDDIACVSGDVVIDCGANMGLFSAVAAQKGCSVFAFEPIPYVIENYLSKTATAYPAITICRNALWDRKEELLFKMMPENIGATTAIAGIYGEFERSDDVRVEAITLDDFVEDHGLDRVDFIKADIEGAERNMLRGARKVLKRFAPKLAICTYHLPDDPKVIRDIVLEANPDYRIVEKYKKLYAHVPKSN